MTGFLYRIKHKFSEYYGILIRALVSVHRRNNYLIVYGGALDLFIDNAKHLFILNHKALPEYQHVWLTKKDDVVQRLRNMGFKVERSDSRKGRRLLYQAGIVIYDNDINDFANYDLSEGALRFELWHAVQGVKYIGKIKSDPPQPYIQELNFKEKYIKKHLFGDYALATSTSLKSVMSAAFEVPIDNSVVADQQRSHTLFMTSEELDNFVEKYESVEGQQVFYELKKETRKKIIYMPTFRDADPGYIYKAIPDWEAFNSFLYKNDLVLYLKVHRVTPLPQGFAFSNIKVLDNGLDIYPLLPLFDRLITDYSSIMYEFALLRKPIIIYDYDLDDYATESRHVFKSFIELLKVLSEAKNYKDLERLILTRDSEIKQIPLDNYFDCPGDYSCIYDLIKSRL